MKSILLSTLIILSISNIASSTKLRTNTRGWGVHNKIENLNTDIPYYIYNQAHQKFFGKSALGWVFANDASYWRIKQIVGPIYQLKHYSGNYLKITDTGRAFSKTVSSYTNVQLTNSGNGICISRFETTYLRMYPQFVFPIIQYRTNTASSCESWERFDFRYYN